MNGVKNALETVILLTEKITKARNLAVNHGTSEMSADEHVQSVKVRETLKVNCSLRRNINERHRRLRTSSTFCTPATYCPTRLTKVFSKFSLQPGKE